MQFRHTLASCTEPASSRAPFAIPSNQFPTTVPSVQQDPSLCFPEIKLGGHNTSGLGQEMVKLIHAKAMKGYGWRIEGRLYAGESDGLEGEWMWTLAWRVQTRG